MQVRPSFLADGGTSQLRSARLRVHSVLSGWRAPARRGISPWRHSISSNFWGFRTLSGWRTSARRGILPWRQIDLKYSSDLLKCPKPTNISASTPHATRRLVWVACLSPLLRESRGSAFIEPEIMLDDRRRCSDICLVWVASLSHVGRFGVGVRSRAPVTTSQKCDVAPLMQRTTAHHQA